MQHDMALPYYLSVFFICFPQWRTTPSYNIFWSEKNSLAKIIHLFTQMFVFPFLPIVVLAQTAFSSTCEACTPCGWLIRQSQVREINTFHIPIRMFLTQLRPA